MINDDVIGKQTTLKLSDLRGFYISHLQKTPFPNPDYMGENLKSNVKRCKIYEGLLGFCPIGNDGEIYSYLVFSTNMDVSNAIRASYQFGGIDKVKVVAGLVNAEVVTTFKNTNDIMICHGH